ncbi:hypothetical protein [Shimia sp. Alg240-R146]|uniref:hypothetical protein n=1 Tax=Shimia sp. Alg240-R146 TaxID=2993449 RepID=UPI0022DF5639|nr:hypothetical protein [Shimia sp. Alg240-R146]
MVLIFIWIPLDTKTGIVERARGKFVIGDALAPTVAAGFVLLGGLLLLVFERNAEDQPALGPSKIKFVASVVAVIGVGFAIMRFAGPAAVEVANLFREDPLEYRLLRATPVWKHIGYVMGGTIMVSGIIAIVERKMSRRAVLTGIAAVVVLIAVFDLPFDDLLLPPNGDV